MILIQNYEVPICFSIYIIVKILCKLVERQRVSMLKTHPTLNSIPETNELEDEVVKWVPKKKHEVLKAKYKCLKKLFQIYDASVIGILPDTYTQEPSQTDEQKSHRRKRSHRTKTDACAGTTDTCGDISETEKSVATAVIKDLKLDQISSSEIDKSKTTLSKIKDDKSTQDSKEDLLVDSERDYESQQPRTVPYVMIHEKRKPTRFQSFVQRILGIKREKNYSYIISRDHPYAVSDNDVSNRYERRRRRGLRFRRNRRPKKTHSEIALRDVNSPVILSYVQSIQRNCLMDRTSRQCPITGCKWLSYGIINYNDHLNLSHFTDRTFICLYCHEGFTTEYDKSIHENQHIGISKLNTMLATAASTTRFSTKIASNTQTDPEMSKINVPDEKLKKIVSFFDKIIDSDNIVDQVKRDRNSETNLRTLHRNPNTDTESQVSKYSSDSSDSKKKTRSFTNVKNSSKITSTLGSDGSSNLPPVRCQLCGENFDFRRQLNLHVDLEHRIHDKFSKYHSCAGILNRFKHQDGRLNIHSTTQSLTQSVASTDILDVSRRKSEETLSYEPSTNIVYYTSTESVNKKQSVNGLVQKVRSGFCYKWEPGTKIIRV